MPSAPSTTPGTISISFRLWMRKRPVSSTHSSMNGSRKACSASDCDRYAPSTIRQYSRPLLVFITPDPEARALCESDWGRSLRARGARHFITGRRRAAKLFSVGSGINCCSQKDTEGTKERTLLFRALSGWVLTLLGELRKGREACVERAAQVVEV